MNRIQKKCSAGFTLVELILALSIFGLIGVLVASTFSGGLRLNRRADEGNAYMQEARFFLDLLAKEIENMVHYDFSKSYPEEKDFIGGVDKIQFIQEADDGLMVIKYYLGDPENDLIQTTIIGQTYSKNVAVTTGDDIKDSSKYLVRKQTPLIDYLSGNSKENSEVEIISQNIKSGGFRLIYEYPKEDGDDSEQKQVSFWENAKRPLSITVKLSFIFDSSKTAELNLERKILIPTNIILNNDKVEVSKN